MLCSFFSMQDIFEILFFSLITYYFSLWLKQDKRSNLILYFFGYCMIFTIAHLMNLATIALFLLCTAPIALLLFIIFHQEILQRNFIALTHKATTDVKNEEWAEHLMRSCLHAINNNKQLICVIEHKLDIQPFIESEFIFNAPLSQNLLTLITDSNSYGQNKLIWCNSRGKLIGVNSQWRTNKQNPDITQSLHELPEWKQDALLLTLKTDTFIFKADPKKRAFDVVMKGTLYESLAAHRVLLLLKKHLTLPPLQGDFNHDQQRNNSEQPYC